VRISYVIGFEEVIRVLLGDVARGGYQLFVHLWVGLCPVRDHLGRVGAVVKDADEEPAGARQISLLRDQDVETWPYWSIARYATMIASVGNRSPTNVDRDRRTRQGRRRIGSACPSVWSVGATVPPQSRRPPRAPRRVGHLHSHPFR
jgi:hypothetical protein